MKITRKSVFLMTLIALMLCLAVSSSFALVGDPVLFEVNDPDGSDDPRLEGLTMLKYNDKVSGTLTATIAGSEDTNKQLVIAITAYGENNGTVDWEIIQKPYDLEIRAVFLKSGGGTVGNMFFYDPGWDADEGLYTPTNPQNNKPFGLSHVDFYYELVEIETTELDVAVDGAGAMTSTVDYDWTITKSVTPDSALLEKEESEIDTEIFTYTLTADRTAKTPVLSDVKVSGEVTVTNNGSADPIGLKVEVRLMNGATEVRGWLGITANEDNGEYSYSFSGLSNLAYTVETRVTLDNGTANNPAPLAITTSTTENWTDETAQVTDNIALVLEDLEANGYDCEISETIPVDKILTWDINNDWTKEYTVTVTNSSAADNDKRDVTNTATLIPKDSEALTDDAVISITTPKGENNGHLTEVTTDFVASAIWAQTVDYDWTIKKDVAYEGSTRLSRGDELELLYTLTATRTENEPVMEGTVAGTVTVTNIGEYATKDLKVEVQVLAVADEEDEADVVVVDWTTIGGADLAAAGEGTYTFSFDDLSGDEYRVEVRTYISNGSHEDPQSKLIEGSEETEPVVTDETATVTDELGSLNGFDITALDGFPWHIGANDLNNDGVATKEFNVTLTNENAARGIERDLVNWATLTEDDSKDVDRDDAVVEITTPGGGGGGGNDDDDDNDTSIDDDNPEEFEVDEEVVVTAPVVVEQPANEVIELVELPAPAAALPATGGAMIPFAAVGSALIGLGLYLKRY